MKNSAEWLHFPVAQHTESLKSRTNYDIFSINLLVNHSLASCVLIVG